MDWEMQTGMLTLTRSKSSMSGREDVWEEQHAQFV